MALPRFDTAQLTLFRTPFNDPYFLFELKVDGFGGLAYIDDGKCELVSRRRNPYKSFKELQNSLAQLSVKNAILDGEIACVHTPVRPND
jgi:bifunctional non-homologous end joining protein LigD